MKLEFPPRIIRANQAPGYLGMNRELFYAQIKPYLAVIRFGERSRGYERVELDKVFDVYKMGKCSPPKKPLSAIQEGVCQKEQPAYGSIRNQGFGKLTKKSKGNEFSSALASAKASGS